MRYILHSDLNNFYASCECLYNPSIRNKAVVVVGDAEKRHGIVLAKNYIAKKYNIKTGDTIYEARNKCEGELVCVKADFEKYLRISHMVKDIYKEYSDQMESFGIDEAWIDISHRAKNFDEAYAIADEIRLRVFDEIGLTVSVGVSFNKVFAKLASDLKKPNAVTVITDKNFKDIIWPLPVSDLLYVGHATAEKLLKFNINTIGDLAKCDTGLLKSILGKNGLMIQSFARGEDSSPVHSIYDKEDIKSIGNSVTLPHDLEKLDEILATFTTLAHSVSKRMSDHHFRCKGIAISVKDKDLNTAEHHTRLVRPTNSVSELTHAAYDLFCHNYPSFPPIRALGLRACDLVPDSDPVQYSLFTDMDKIIKLQKLDSVVNSIRDKFGPQSIYHADTRTCDISDATPDDEKHSIHPVGYRRDRS